MHDKLIMVFLITLPAAVFMYFLLLFFFVVGEIIISN